MPMCDWSSDVCSSDLILRCPGRPGTPSRPRRGIASPVAIRRGEGAQRKRCRDILITISSVNLWRRQWHPTPVLLPGKSHGRRSLVGCSPGGREESDTTERLHFDFSFHALEKEMATYSSVLAWRIPGTGEPGGLPFMSRPVIFYVGNSHPALPAFSSH